MAQDSAEATSSEDEIKMKKKPFLQSVKIIATKVSTKASIGEEIDQHHHDSFHSQSSPLKNQFRQGPDGEPRMLRQLEQRPVSHEQLVVEVKAIYAGIAIVEAKCIETDERQLAAAKEKEPLQSTPLENHQWQALIALHRQLIHEHHDFLIASQHPSASPAVSRLATKYEMPARLWRHGIHAFLEVLRYRLPESLEHMVTFICIAYSMLALLYEVVSIFEDSWIECLGDIARYRMAIEDGDLKAREVWSSTARSWYNKASQKSPNVGRLYHHLAILTPRYSMEQLSLYTRSLTCITPYESARESIITVFKPLLHAVGRSAVERSLICAHTIFLIDQTQNSDTKFDAIFDRLAGDRKCIAAVRSGNFGAFAAISNIAALFEYGIPKSRLRLAYEVARKMKDTASEFEPHDPIQVEHPLTAEGITGLDSNAMTPLDYGIPSSLITKASRLASETLGIWLNCGTDKNIHPLVHIYLVFIRSLIVAQEAWKPFENDAAWRTIERDIPWYPLCSFLNTVAGKFPSTSTIFAEDFPQSRNQNGDKAENRPLPEDFTLRGQMYSQWYFPRTWFAKTLVDGDEHNVELPSMNEARIERILWLGHRIASADRWIGFDVAAGSFVVTDYVTNEL